GISGLSLIWYSYAFIETCLRLTEFNSSLRISAVLVKYSFYAFHMIVLIGFTLAMSSFHEKEMKSYQEFKVEILAKCMSKLTSGELYVFTTAVGKLERIEPSVGSMFPI